MTRPEVETGSGPSPMLVHISLDAKSIILSPGEISYRNDTDIVCGRLTSGFDFRPEVENECHLKPFQSSYAKVKDQLKNQPKQNLYFVKSRLLTSETFSWLTKS